MTVSDLVCPCGGRYDTVVAWEPAYRIVRCESCGLKATDPREPGPDHYDDHYFTQNYLDRADYWRRSHAHWFHAVVEPLMATRERPRILDVGCGIGLFLSTVPAGWERVGLEPSPNAAQVARDRFGLDVRPVRLESFAPDGGYDVVTFWDVVEHVPDPIATLRAAARHVRGDGILVVKVPDIDRAALLAGRALARVRKGTIVFQAGAHLYQFDRETLASTLHQAGFVPDRIESRTPPFGLQAFFIPGRLSGRIARLALHAAGLGRTLVSVSRPLSEVGDGRG